MTMANFDEPTDADVQTTAMLLHNTQIILRSASLCNLRKCLRVLLTDQQVFCRRCPRPSYYRRQPAAIFIALRSPLLYGGQPRAWTRSGEDTGGRGGALPPWNRP